MLPLIMSPTKSSLSTSLQMVEMVMETSQVLTRARSRNAEETPPSVITLDSEPQYISEQSSQSNITRNNSDDITESHTKIVSRSLHIKKHAVHIKKKSKEKKKPMKKSAKSKGKKKNTKNVKKKKTLPKKKTKISSPQNRKKAKKTRRQDSNDSHNIPSTSSSNFELPPSAEKAMCKMMQQFIDKLRLKDQLKSELIALRKQIKVSKVKRANLVRDALALKAELQNQITKTQEDLKNENENHEKQLRELTTTLSNREKEADELDTLKEEMRIENLKIGRRYSEAQNWRKAHPLIIEDCKVCEKLIKDDRERHKLLRQLQQKSGDLELEFKKYASENPHLIKDHRLLKEEVNFLKDKVRWTKLMNSHDYRDRQLAKDQLHIAEEKYESDIANFKRNYCPRPRP